MLYDWLKHIVFAEPLLLSGMIIIPILVFWYIKKGDKKQASIKVSSAYPFSVSTWKNKMRHLPFILRLLSLAALILALARPQKRISGQNTKGEGIDIVLCMDVSGSMGSADIPPSRMEVAKEVAEEFVRSRPVDRIGLVIFSGESFTQCPVTTDKNTLIRQIQSLESRKYLADGTVIGEGLATAVDRLTKSDAKSKVIILLTDGKEDPPETRLIDPLTALEIAKSRSVKVYTIGMNAGAGVTTSATTPLRRTTADFLDEELLQKIAGETGGKYFRARDKNGLQSIYKEIDQLEKSYIEITSFERVEEKFIPFVLAALLFIFLELLLRFTLLRKFP